MKSTFNFGDHVGQSSLHGKDETHAQAACRQWLDAIAEIRVSKKRPLVLKDFVDTLCSQGPGVQRAIMKDAFHAHVSGFVGASNFMPHLDAFKKKTDTFWVAFDRMVGIEDIDYMADVEVTKENVFEDVRLALRDLFIAGLFVVRPLQRWPTRLDLTEPCEQIGLKGMLERTQVEVEDLCQTELQIQEQLMKSLTAVVTTVLDQIIALEFKFNQNQQYLNQVDHNNNSNSAIKRKARAWLLEELQRIRLEGGTLANWLSAWAEEDLEWCSYVSSSSRQYFKSAAGFPHVSNRLSHHNHHHHYSGSRGNGDSSNSDRARDDSAVDPGGDICADDDDHDAAATLLLQLKQQQCWRYMGVAEPGPENSIRSSLGGAPLSDSEVEQARQDLSQSLDGRWRSLAPQIEELLQFLCRYYEVDFAMVTTITDGGVAVRCQYGMDNMGGHLAAGVNADMGMAACQLVPRNKCLCSWVLDSDLTDPANSAGEVTAQIFEELRAGTSAPSQWPGLVVSDMATHPFLSQTNLNTAWGENNEFRFSASVPLVIRDPAGPNRLVSIGSLWLGDRAPKGNLHLQKMVMAATVVEKLLLANDDHGGEHDADAALRVFENDHSVCVFSYFVDAPPKVNKHAANSKGKIKRWVFSCVPVSEEPRTRQDLLLSDENADEDDGGDDVHVAPGRGGSGRYDAQLPEYAARAFENSLAALFSGMQIQKQQNITTGGGEQEQWSSVDGGGDDDDDDDDDSAAGVAAFFDHLRGAERSLQHSFIAMLLLRFLLDRPLVKEQCLHPIVEAATAAKASWQELTDEKNLKLESGLGVCWSLLSDFKTRCGVVINDSVDVGNVQSFGFQCRMDDLLALVGAVGDELPRPGTIGADVANLFSEVFERCDYPFRNRYYARNWVGTSLHAAAVALMKYFVSQAEAHRDHSGTTDGIEFDPFHSGATPLSAVQPVPFILSADSEPPSSLLGETTTAGRGNTMANGKNYTKRKLSEKSRSMMRVRSQATFERWLAHRTSLCRGPSLFEDTRIHAADIELPDIEIDRGSTCKVFLGIWRGLHVVIKAPHEINTTTQQQRDSIETVRILQEIALSHALRHQNIVLYYGTVHLRNKMCFLSEFCHGGTAFRVVHCNVEQKDRLSIAQRADMLRQIASGMCYLHHEGVMHRDLKSLNVFLKHNLFGVDSRPEIKIGDFGLATVFTPCESTQRCAGVGTLQWMAPEVILGSNVTESCDVWSYGVVMIELIFGIVPFCPEELETLAADMCLGCGKDEPQRDYYRRIMENLFCRGYSLDKHLLNADIWGRRFNQVLRACLQLQPQRRLTFVDVCEQILDHGPGYDRRPSARKRTGKMFEAPATVQVDIDAVDPYKAFDAWEDQKIQRAQQKEKELNEKEATPRNSNISDDKKKKSGDDKSGVDISGGGSSTNAKIIDNDQFVCSNSTMHAANTEEHCALDTTAGSSSAGATSDNSALKAVVSVYGRTITVPPEGLYRGDIEYPRPVCPPRGHEDWQKANAEYSPLNPPIPWQKENEMPTHQDDDRMDLLIDLNRYIANWRRQIEVVLTFVKHAYNVSACMFTTVRRDQVTNPCRVGTAVFDVPRHQSFCSWTLMNKYTMEKTREKILKERFPNWPNVDTVDDPECRDNANADAAAIDGEQQQKQFDLEIMSGDEEEKGSSLLDSSFHQERRPDPQIPGVDNDDPDSTRPLMIVPDASLHPAFKNHPAVAKRGHKFYAGFPIHLLSLDFDPEDGSRDVVAIGTISLLDTEARYDFIPNLLEKVALIFTKCLARRMDMPQPHEIAQRFRLLDQMPNHRRQAADSFIVEEVLFGVKDPFKPRPRSPHEQSYFDMIASFRRNQKKARKKNKNRHQHGGDGFGSSDQSDFGGKAASWCAGVRGRGGNSDVALSGAYSDAAESVQSFDRHSAPPDQNQGTALLPRVDELRGTFPAPGTNKQLISTSNSYTSPSRSDIMVRVASSTAVSEPRLGWSMRGRTALGAEQQLQQYQQLQPETFREPARITSGSSSRSSSRQTGSADGAPKAKASASSAAPKKQQQQQQPLQRSLPPQYYHPVSGGGGAGGYASANSSAQLSRPSLPWLGDGSSSRSEEKDIHSSNTGGGDSGMPMHRALEICVQQFRAVPSAKNHVLFAFCHHSASIRRQQKIEAIIKAAKFPNDQKKKITSDGATADDSSTPLPHFVTINGGSSTELPSGQARLHSLLAERKYQALVILTDLRNAHDIATLTWMLKDLYFPAKTHAASSRGSSERAAAPCEVKAMIIYAPAPGSFAQTNENLFDQFRAMYEIGAKQIITMADVPQDPFFLKKTLAGFLLKSMSPHTGSPDLSWLIGKTVDP